MSTSYLAIAAARRSISTREISPTILRLTRLISVVLLSTAWSQDHGETAEVKFPPLVVTTSRLAAPLNQTSASTTVITRIDIEANHPEDIIDVLQSIPGVHVDRAGGRGGIGSIYIRGADPNFTAVLIDGVKINDPANSRGGSVDLSTIDLVDVERIEVVRGPLSAVHGSGAIGGVIHIITRIPRNERLVHLAGGFGDRHRLHNALNAAGPFLNSKSAYSLTAVYDDNGDPADDGDYRGRRIKGGLVFDMESAELRIDSSYNQRRSSSFPDDSGGVDFASRRDTDERESRDFILGMNFEHTLTSDVTYRLAVNWFDRHEKQTSPGVAPGRRDPFGIPANNNDNRFEQLYLEFNTDLRLTDAMSLNIGVSGEFEDGTGDTRLSIPGAEQNHPFSLRRESYALYSEIRYRFSRDLTISAGSRIDDTDDFGHEFSPGIGILWTLPSTNTALRANWGEGFKLPSFFALGNPIVGNSSLKPETSESFDLGIEQGFAENRVRINAGVFHNRFFDIVDFDEGPPPRLVNRSEVTSQGIELGLDARITESLSIRNHLTYVQTNIRNDPEKLRNRPEWRGGFTINWRPATTLSVQIAYLHIGEVFDSSIPTGDVVLDDYQRVDVSGTWTITDNIKMSFSIDNLFDGHFEEAVGFSDVGIRFRIGIRVRM